MEMSLQSGTGAVQSARSRAEEALDGKKLALPWRRWPPGDVHTGASGRDLSGQAFQGGSQKDLGHLWGLMRFCHMRVWLGTSKNLL